MLGVVNIKSREIIGLNVKWYRYQKGWTQEVYANKTKFKMAYISYIETGFANLTCRSIDFIAESFKISPKQLFDEKTAELALKLPPRVNKYKKI